MLRHPTTHRGQGGGAVWLLLMSSGDVVAVVVVVVVAVVVAAAVPLRRRCRGAQFRRLSSGGRAARWSVLLPDGWPFIGRRVVAAAVMVDAAGWVAAGVGEMVCSACGAQRVRWVARAYIYKVIGERSGHERRETKKNKEKSKKKSKKICRFRN